MKDLDEAICVANYVAPEHLELQVKEENISYLQSNIKTAGALLLGRFSATALGDFMFDQVMYCQLIVIMGFQVCELKTFLGDLPA